MNKGIFLKGKSNLRSQLTFVSSNEFASQSYLTLRLVYFTSSYILYSAKIWTSFGRSVRRGNTEYAGKSALVLFYNMNPCVQYKSSTTRLLYLTLVCLYVIALAYHMY